MRVKLLLATLLIALMPAALFAAGKIHGKVVDKETGEPLIGATVRLIGTTRGATTDVNGIYDILQVGVGTYTLEASYIGYQPVRISNIFVNEGLTTDANFSLTKSAVQVAPVTIIAQRPLIEKSATNETRIINGSSLNSIPLRDMTQVAALQPGVILRNNQVYIRGSRPDATGYTLNGVTVTDPVYGGSAVTIPQESVEQIQVMTGGYPAEYGGASAGIVSTELRTGGQKLNISFQAETDNFTKRGTKALGTYSYGYSDYVGTISTPIVSEKIRFFGSIENTFYRDPGSFVALYGSGVNGQTGLGGNFSIANPNFWNGLNYQGLAPSAQFTPQSPNTAVDTLLNINYPVGNQIGGQLNQYSYAATLLFDLGNIQLKTSGSYSNTFSQQPGSISDVFDYARLPQNYYQNGFANIKLTQFFDAKTYYELNLNYMRTFRKTGFDPLLQGNFVAYSDTNQGASNPSLANGSTTLANAPWYFYGGAPLGVTVYQAGTLLSGVEYGGPAIHSEASLGGRLDFSTEIKNNAIRVGGEYNYYTIRHFAPARLTSLYNTMKDPNLTLQQQENVLRAGGYNNYGYDILGNVINNNVMIGNVITDFGPPHPVNAAIYAQDKIELSDINLNVGLRYDYINPDSWAFTDPRSITFVDTLGVIAPLSLTKTPISQQVSPRLGVSFPVTDQTVFHAQYGKFIQESQLVDSYAGMGLMYVIVNGGNYYQTPNGYGLKPERTTQYELGFSQQVGENASFDITAFYKDIRDQIQMRLLTPSAGATSRNYYTLVNGDFSTSKGLELQVTLRRVDRIQAQFNYTFASAEGTGSSSNSSAGSASDMHGYTANIPFPAAYSQQNTGSLNIDYRFAKDDGGPILQRAGVNLLFTFGSGYPFTLESINYNNPGDARFQVPLEPIGYSTTPWSFSVDLRIDKTVTIASSVDAMFYIYVQNLLDAHNAYNVFIGSGSPYNDGWLGTSAGQAYAATQSDPALYQSLYNSAYLGNNANNFLSPRQIRFGVKLDY